VVQIFSAVVAAVVALAARQRGAASRPQLLALGMTSSAITRWTEGGRLHRVHHGVYLLGHPVPAPLAHEQAALLACGDDSCLSHRTAGRVHGLIEWDGPIDVTTRRHRGRPKGVTVHTTRRLESRDTTRRHGLRITTIARTLLDLAECLDDAELERAVESAFAQRRVTEKQLRDLIARSPGRHGAAVLGALLDYRGDDGFTRSRAEDVMRQLTRRARLPQPRANARVGGYEVDFLWPEERVIVEVDSWAHHSSRASFEQDRRKRADLQAADYTVLPVTWRQMTGQPEAMAARIAAALALAARRWH
jgi:very-short-patch-repair endonuclease